MKRFTPPRKLAGGQSETEESDYSDSEYSYSDSYTLVKIYFTALSIFNTNTKMHVNFRLGLG